MKAPGPQITGTRYVLAVPNLAASADYYQTKLGFTTTWAGQGWHFLHRDACTLMLGECPDAPAAGMIGDHSYFAYLEVKDIDALYREFLAKGLEIIMEIADQPWGQREFGIRTMDGHRMMFGEGRKSGEE